MLTIRKIRVASGDSAAARRAAEYVLNVTESPAAHARTPSDALPQPLARWLGSPRMLEQLQVTLEADVTVAALARAVQGRSAGSGERVRIEGLLVKDVRDEHGHRRRVRMRGTKSVDLTFSAPKSVSAAWSQASADLRSAIEEGMLVAAGSMLENMTQAKPVVWQQGSLWPARGFAAAAALHVKARVAQGESAAAPQLHVHGLVVGVERADGFFASPELSGMFKRGAPLEGGAVARARLAERLVELGFEIETRGRYFELRGVPAGLIERMSGRKRDVDARIGEREAVRRKPLTNGERSVAALQTRSPKSHEASAEETVATWTAHATDFDFGPSSVEALRVGPGFTASLDARRAAVTAAVRDRLRQAGSERPLYEARAAVYECGAGVLRLEEAHALVADMEGKR